MVVMVVVVVVGLRWDEGVRVGVGVAGVKVWD